jgi:hypothetical protein
MKFFFESHGQLSQHFKTISSEELPRALQWFDDQRFENNWHLTTEEQLALLGNAPLSLYKVWLAWRKFDGAPAPSDETVRRLSILVGIHKSLEILTPHNQPDYAVRWFLTSNHSATCAGKSIKAYLLANNTLEGFRDIEVYLIDAVNGFLGGSYT